MYATQELLKVGRLDQDVRSQSTAALMAAMLTVASVGWLYKEAMVEASASKLALAVFMTGFAGLFVHIALSIRHRAAQTEALLNGPPLEVLRGRRAHVNLQISAVTQPLHIAFNLGVFPILIGMSALSMLPWSFTLAASVVYAGYLLYVAMVRLPRLRREMAVFDALMAELRSA